MTRQTEQRDLSIPQITRRRLMVNGGVALVGTTLLGFPLETIQAQEVSSAELKRRGIMSKNGGMKPTLLPESGSQDPVARSIAENLFWNEQVIAKRLEQFSGGDTAINMQEAAQFWTMIMGEHADFIAHLLDPVENALVQKAMQTSNAFRQMNKSTHRRRSSRSRRPSMTSSTSKLLRRRASRPARSRASFTQRWLITFDAKRLRLRMSCDAHRDSRARVDSITGRIPTRWDRVFN